uniref:Uncharacterized protein n=1 Tax=Timema shepardi TaxID=629360 RepID=A0A7R9FZA8_TIMSH|nr:unnamed protein product [Timema shepardi]
MSGVMPLSSRAPALAVMSTFLYTLLGLTVGSSLHCSVRREISPCTCRVQEPDTDTTVVACERMASFSQVVQALQYKFPSDADITLKIAYSQLEDLEGHSLQELGLAVTNLKLNHDNLSYCAVKYLFAAVLPTTDVGNVSHIPGHTSSCDMMRREVSSSPFPTTTVGMMATGYVARNSAHEDVGALPLHYIFLLPTPYMLVDRTGGNTERTETEANNDTQELALFSPTDSGPLGRKLTPRSIAQHEANTTILTMALCDHSLGVCVLRVSVSVFSESRCLCSHSLGACVLRVSVPVFSESRCLCSRSLGGLCSRSLGACVLRVSVSCVLRVSVSVFSESRCLCSHSLGVCVLIVSVFVFSESRWPVFSESRWPVFSESRWPVFSESRCLCSQSLGVCVLGVSVACVLGVSVPVFSESRCLVFSEFRCLVFSESRCLCSQSLGAFVLRVSVPLFSESRCLCSQSLGACVLIVSVSVFSESRCLCSQSLSSRPP